VVEPLFDIPPLAEAMYWHSRNTSDPAHRWLRAILAGALCIFLMAHAGTFGRFAGVRFMFCQLGGAAAICCGRWHFHAIQAREQAAALGRELPIWAGTDLTDVLFHVWLDTHTQDRHALWLVLEEVGPRGVVLGGDYPVTAPELGMHYVQAELDTLDLSPEVLTSE
jgi:hypothetical protein